MSGSHAAAQESGADDWMKEVKGAHRCLFDFPQHKNGMPLLHILNYLNTYTTSYKTAPGQAGEQGAHRLLCALLGHRLTHFHGEIAEYRSWLRPLQALDADILDDEGLERLGRSLR